MAKFDPAPVDKHAEKPDGKQKSGKDKKLDKELDDTFPASDPASVTQPSQPAPK